MRRAAVFHDLQLSLIVQCARQALAIDEPRTSLPPCLWESPEGETQDPRIRQVWFEGAHADVGGGYRSTGLSDTTLLSMARERPGKGSSSMKHSSVTTSPAVQTPSGTVPTGFATAWYMSFVRSLGRPERATAKNTSPDVAG